jgi:hypothetical protein
MGDIFDKNNPSLDLEEHYQFYLSQGQVKESDMGKEQRVEMRRAFMAGAAQLLFIFTKGISNMEEEQGVAAISSLTLQIGEFWSKQTIDY